MYSDKIAIAVLTKGYDDIRQYQMLIDRNNSIFDKIVSHSKYQFDMLIFHEGNITTEHQEYIASQSKLPLLFKNVKEHGNCSAFDDTRNKLNMELCPPTGLSSWFSLGYKHMCHFWSIDLFDYLDEYTYILRIDEDVIVNTFDDSILEHMITNDIKFGTPLVCYYNGKLDDPDVMVGMQELTETFCENKGIQPKTNFDEIMGAYTNFMILNLSYFKNNNVVQSFLNEIENSHGIYSNRWGDASIWGIIIYWLLNEEFSILNDVEYYHASHDRYVNKKG